MTRIRIPKNAGEFRIIIARAGNYAVWNNKTGKNKLFIPCKNKAQAEEILRRLRKRDHNDEMWI